MADMINGKTPGWYASYARMIPAMTSEQKLIYLEIADCILNLESRLAQAERERDAAVADLEDSADCEYCQHEIIFHTCPGINCHTCQRDCPCARCSKRYSDGFKWRGVCEENTKEDNK